MNVCAVCRFRYLMNTEKSCAYVRAFFCEYRIRQEWRENFAHFEGPEPFRMRSGAFSHLLVLSAVGSFNFGLERGYLGFFSPRRMYQESVLSAFLQPLS